MIRFVDVEASSLEPGGFPIEVAWVDENGQSETYLIRPTEAWLAAAGDPAVWDARSETLHGIALATLVETGARPAYVAERVVASLVGRHLMACSDAPGFDTAWLDQLLAAAGVPHRVRLDDVTRLYGLACSPLRDLLPPGDGPGRDRAEEHIRDLALRIVEGARDVEEARPGAPHRALPDAMRLWRTWRTIRDRVAEQVTAEGGR